MVDEVKSPENLTQRGKTYYYRARVPDDLRSHFGKREFAYSLKTSDRRIALERHARKHLEVTQLVSEARRQGKSTPAAVAAADLSEEDCKRLASLWLADFLETDLNIFRSGSPSLAFLESMDIGNDEFEQSLQAGLMSLETHFDPSSVRVPVQDTLRRFNLSVAPQSPGYARLCAEFMRAGLRAVQVCRRRHRGYMGDEVPSSASLPLPQVLAQGRSDLAGPSLDELLDYWRNGTDCKHRTLTEVQHAFRLLQAQHGDERIDGHSLKPEHVIHFKDVQLQAGKSPATVRKQLNLMAAVFSNAQKNRKVPVNPFAGISVKLEKRPKKPRVPFNLDELRAVFSTPVFTQSVRPKGGAEEAAFWLPLLALYSGARLEELAQLLVADVQEADGIWYLHITDIPDDEDTTIKKSLKNASSRRKTPVHPELVRIGFLAYHSHMRGSGAVRLFPKVTTSSGEKRQQSANFSKWFGRYLRDVAGVSDSRKTFHSFRHGFKDAARRAGVPTEQHHAMTGHGTGNVGDKYGDDYFPLEPLNASMSSIRYDGLDLTWLAWPGRA